jgi:predicted nucleic acid-binding Zn ribbon protein
MEIGAGLWFLAALIVGLVASREFGRSGTGWFLLAILLTPLIGVLLFLLPPRRVPCPFCAEPIKPSAVVCRFCNRPIQRSQHRSEAKGFGRLLVVLLIVIGMGLAMSRCNDEFQWWKRTAPPIQVSTLDNFRDISCSARYHDRDAD